MQTNKAESGFSHHQEDYVCEDRHLCDFFGAILRCQLVDRLLPDLACSARVLPFQFQLLTLLHVNDQIWSFI